jgi:hypothetical protein
MVISTTPAGRKQLQLHVARDAGVVRKIRVQRVPQGRDRTKLEPVLELDRDQSARLIELIRSLDTIPVEGERSVYVDDQLLSDVLGDPSAVSALYARDPERFRALIETDADAENVVALQRRRDVTTRMRRWLEDGPAFDEASRDAGGPERAWQQLLEENPWVLGVGLGGQLLTSWKSDLLEQTVVGRSVNTVGKRVDALMRTTGVIRSMVFAEIKHHRTDLIGGEHRAGCWRPAKELTEAVVQAQQTVHLACRDLDEYLQDRTGDGELLGSGTFLLRPKSFLVIGSLSQLTGSSGNPHPEKFRSFELFRRNLHEPDVITFDELVARAEWHVQSASSELPAVDRGAVRTAARREGRRPTTSSEPWSQGDAPW